MKEEKKLEYCSTFTLLPVVVVVVVAVPSLSSLSHQQITCVSLPHTRATHAAVGLDEFLACTTTTGFEVLQLQSRTLKRSLVWKRAFVSLLPPCCVDEREGEENWRSSDARQAAAVTARLQDWTLQAVIPDAREHLPLQPESGE